MRRKIVVEIATIIICVMGLFLQVGMADEGHSQRGITLPSHGVGYGYGHDDVESTSRFLHDLVEHQRAIGLTPAQADTVKSIQFNLSRMRLRAEAEMEVAELELQTLVENDATGAGTVEAKLKQLGDLEQGLRMAAIKAKREARSMLTPEQRKKEATERQKLQSRESTVRMFGTWTGTLSSQMKDGEMNLTWTVYQSGSNVSGRFVCSGGTLKCPNVAGEISGILINDDFTGRLVYMDTHLCGFVGRLSGMKMQGEYSCDDKLGEDRGTWRMAWQTPGPP